MARLDARFPGWHPVVQMAEIANDETLPIQERFQAAKEVAKYVTPQLKAIEHSGAIESPLTAITRRIIDQIDKQNARTGD